MNSYLPHHLRRSHNDVILGGELVDEMDVPPPILEQPKPQEKPLMEEVDRLCNEIDKFPTKDPYKDKTRKLFVKEGEKVMSMIFGKVRAYDKKELVNSSITNSGKFTELENALRNLMKIHNPKFRYTTIQVNKSLETPWHYDKGNVGMSYLIAFGNFKGGGTVARRNGKDLLFNNNHAWLYFDGHNSYHKSAKSRGDRYAVVYYTKS
tara:strand:+ start:532 stop:1152 length:621 start_codon:yes stop_codon:yes gene_type:complete